MAVLGMFFWNGIMPWSPIAFVWSIGSIVFSWAAGLHFIMNFNNPYRKHFGLILCFVAMVGLFIFFGFFIGHIQSHP